MTNTKDALEHIRKAMELIPPDSLAVAVMRHAERGKIPKGEYGNDILLTEKGKLDAVDAGNIMRGRISQVLHSPVERCLQTAEGILQGANTEIISEEWMGLRCDVYVADIEKATPTLSLVGKNENGFYAKFVEHMSICANEIPYEHFFQPLSGTIKMMQGIMGKQTSGLCLGLTHDWLVNVAVAYATGEMVNEKTTFAQYLDALFIWIEGDHWNFYYKGRTGKCPNNFSNALCSY